MLKALNKGFSFFIKNKVVVFLIFLAALVNSPLKSNGVTFLGAVFLAIFFIGGFVGLLHRIEIGKMETKVGIKSFLIEAGASFSFVILNLFETLIISVFNIIVVIFFAVLPMIVLQTRIDERYSQTILALIVVMVVAYRLPLIMYSYFTVIVNKAYGKSGIGKLKEIVWESPVIWISVFIQAAFYIAMSILAKQFESNLILFTIVDVARSMVFMFFTVVNYYIYTNKLENNEKYKEILQSKIYDGRYNSFSGRFIM